MKRVRSACILQTLVFSQKPEMGYSLNQTQELNRQELKRYLDSLERTGTRYVLVDETQEADGSIVIHIKKQYNDKADVSEYF